MIKYNKKCAATNNGYRKLHQNQKPWSIYPSPSIKQVTKRNRIDLTTQQNYLSNSRPNDLRRRAIKKKITLAS
ncbi:hypothetical protein LguiA_006909 [Lonicera macranthoides]